MPIKFLVSGGGAFLGGVSADFNFMGAGIFLTKTDLTRGVSQKKLASEACRATGGVARNNIANRAEVGHYKVQAHPKVCGRSRNVFSPQKNSSKEGIWSSRFEGPIPNCWLHSVG